MLIYKITNKLNNKIYIGCTSHSLQKRWNEHFRQRKNNTKIAKAFTWGTNFKPVSTLATGTTTAKIFTVDFLCLSDNITWIETGRTAAH